MKIISIIIYKIIVYKFKIIIPYVIKCKIKECCCKKYVNNTFAKDFFLIAIYLHKRERSGTSSAAVSLTSFNLVPILSLSQVSFLFSNLIHKFSSLPPFLFWFFHYFHCFSHDCYKSKPIQLLRLYFLLLF